VRDTACVLKKRKKKNKSRVVGRSVAARRQRFGRVLAEGRGTENWIAQRSTMFGSRHTWANKHCRNAWNIFVCAQIFDFCQLVKRRIVDLAIVGAPGIYSS
jgi:hypothetical protein